MASQSSDALPIQFPTGAYFYLCLGVAVLAVILFAKNKFDEPSVDRSEDDFICQLLPRYLATGEEYSKGLAFYIGAMIITVIVLSLLGPNVLQLGGANVPNDADIHNTIPIFVALVLVGVLPNLPMLKEIEQRLRRMAHEIAYIPAAARATAEKLASAAFDFSWYNTQEVLTAPEMRGVEIADFERPRGSLEYSWVRLSCLVYQLKVHRISGDLESLDGELLQRYAADLDNIEDKRKSLEADVAEYRRERATRAYYANDALHRTIRNTLRQLYVLLGCAVRLKVKPHADINLSLKPFGFVLGSVVRQPENRDVMLVALTVMAACVFAVAFAAVGLGYLGLWSRSEFFPQTARDPFMLSISAAFIHGIAILTADRVRARRIGKEDWFASVGLVRAPSRANYIRIAFCCAVMGYISLLAWGLMFQGVTADLFKGTLPYVLLPATTGGFYAYHLDNVELGTRPASRLWEIAPQALVTGFFAFAAAKVGFGFIDAPAGIPDVVALVSVLGATVGASLAWYIPTAAQSSRRDPLVEARKERMSALKTAALKRFEDPALADKWLNQPHPALGNRLPKDAAADVESYEHAISQLQQSQHLVLVPSSSAEQPRLSCSV